MRRSEGEGSAAPDAASALSVGPRWPRLLIVVHATALAVAMGGAMWLDRAADRERRVGLAFLQPLFSLLAEAAPALRRLALPPSWILPGAVLLLALGLLLPRSARHPGPAVALRQSFFLEALALALLTLIILAYRFYALNWLPNDYYGELVFQVVCTSDWHSMLAVNGGGAGPWAPLGLLHYLLNAALWRFSGSTVLTLRFASALSSVLLSQVLYGFVRLVAGPLAAFIATSLYATAPVEMVWGRHSMFPFDFPSIFVLLVGVSTYRAVVRHRTSDWLTTAFLMGLTRHSFASAYGAFAIPFTTVGYLALFDRARLRLSGWRPLLLTLGLGVWLLGPSLAMSSGAGEWRWVGVFDRRLESRAFRGAGWSGSLEAVGANLRKTIGPLYVGKRGDTFQAPVSMFGDRVAFVSPLTTMLFTTGLGWMFAQRRRPEVAVVLSLVLAALLPGLLSTADPHRQTALYPALSAVAGITAATGLRRVTAGCSAGARTATLAAVAAVLALVTARSGAVYFSQPMGEPTSVTIARAIEEEAEPGTLLVLHLPYERQVDISYLIFDDSLSRPFGWMSIPDDEQSWRESLGDFRPRFDHLFHVHTALRHRVPELASRRWKRFAFIIDDTLDPETKVAELAARFGRVEVKHVSPPTWRGAPAGDFTVVSIAR